MGMSDDLKRWVDAGLIDQQTSAAIEAYEAQRPGLSKVGRGLEAIAYLGAVLVLTALVAIAAEFWDGLAPWGRFALGVAVAMVLIFAGVLFSRAEDPAFRRAQMFAWFLSIPAVALAANVAVTQILGVDERYHFVMVSLITLAAAASLWWVRPAVLQTIAMGVTSGVAVIALVTLPEDLPDWSVGVSLASLGVLWMFLTWRGVLKPTRTSYVLAAIGLLSLGFPDLGQLPWPLLGLAAGLILMAVSVPLDQTVLLGMGVAGLFLYIPVTIFEVFGDSLGVPVALLITGLILLGVEVATTRLRRRA